MRNIDAIAKAADLVRAALEAGWLKEESGPVLGEHVSAAIEEITKRLKALDNV